MNWLEFISSVVEIALSSIVPDLLPFIESMTSHLAWPLAAVSLALILRDRILDAIESLDIEAFGVKMSFSRKVSVVAENVAIEEFAGQVDQDLSKDNEKNTSEPQGVEDSSSSSAVKEPAQVTLSNKAIATFLKTLDNRADRALRLSVVLSKTGPLTPIGAVYESWDLIEKTLRDLHGLVAREPDKERRPSLVARHLQVIGLISEGTYFAIVDLYKLRSFAAHADGKAVSLDAARSYAATTSSILKILGDALLENRSILQDL